MEPHKRAKAQSQQPNPHEHTQSPCSLSMSNMNSCFSFLHNWIPIIFTQRLYINSNLPHFTLSYWVSCCPNQSSSLLSSLPALLMKCNYQMLGGRQGSHRSGRHSVIYMWIRSLNNFLSLSFSFSPTHFTPTPHTWLHLYCISYSWLLPPGLALIFTSSMAWFLIAF